MTLSLAVAACARPADQESRSPFEDQEAPGSADGGGDSCAARGDFDIAAFADVILPILSGQLDLNHPEAEPGVGCTSGRCHGSPRAGGLHLDLGDSPENNLERFSCFVDLESPEESQVLLCATDDELCAAHPHPGPALYSGPDDLNYRRILDYIEASRP